MGKTKNDSPGKSTRHTSPTKAATIWGELTDNSHTASSQGVVAPTWSPAITATFEVVRVVGEGGMGKVYLFRNKNTGKLFAVKRPLGLTGKKRESFLRELLVWSDLPKHPNLLQFHSFELVGEDILIFAEYLNEGSLQDWITEKVGHLYVGTKEQALGRILDVAIQSAWGLHCLHTLGLVHRDVKPANLLLAHDTDTKDPGIKARVADFGLAQAKTTIGDPKSWTPAYCSPEQANGEKLDKGTDSWSWGLAVLTMFIGQVPGMDTPAGRCKNTGIRAAEYLAAFLKSNHKNKHIPAMPIGVARVLKSCFRKNPKQRISMDLAAGRLEKVYRTVTKTNYPCLTPPPIKQTLVPQDKSGERRKQHGISWDDPINWLRKALLAGNFDTEEVEAVIAENKKLRRPNSRRGELIFDIVVFDKARTAYTGLINNGNANLRSELADLYVEMALPHFVAGSTSGGLDLYDQAIKLNKMLGEGRKPHLAKVYTGKGAELENLKEYQAAVDLFSSAIRTYKWLISEKHRSEFEYPLANAYNNKAVILCKLARKTVAEGAAIKNCAARIFDKAIKIYKKPSIAKKLSETNQRELPAGLANTYSNKAEALLDSDFDSAMDLYDKAIGIIRDLIDNKHRRELKSNLAKFYLNKATALGNKATESGKQEYRRNALICFEKAILLLHELVYKEKLNELESILARAYFGKASSYRQLSEHRAALDLWEKAIKIFNRLVREENRQEFAIYLAKACNFRKEALNVLNKRTNTAG